jgi:hypothetical protein
MLVAFFALLVASWLLLWLATDMDAGRACAVTLNIALGASTLEHTREFGEEPVRSVATVLLLALKVLAWLLVPAAVAALLGWAMEEENRRWQAGARGRRSKTEQALLSSTQSIIGSPEVAKRITDEHLAEFDVSVAGAEQDAKE